ncbi:Gfo/Idh/MocA family oxidoreductase [candidate division KSB1 bacterium]|nr:Gfo/Idh/MocA family oxidoreductase [candidate division KSB1 bacterium]
MKGKKKYIQVGLGSRSEMYSEAIVQTFRNESELVGLCDNNIGRLQDRIIWAKLLGIEVPGYHADDYERMINETRPDTVIVTTPDCHHDQYICRAMEMGCDVITEKPMTIDERKCQRILDTQKKTGKNIKVTFNYRYSPPRTQVKDLLMQGVIGDVISVDFHWMLDRIHGADYFRRWHRNKSNSGGLMVHKATHHFDLVNWWLSTLPKSVFAIGDRKFYTPQMADRYGLANRGARCHGCVAEKRCGFGLPLAEIDELKKMYLVHEMHDGYYRDQCVFSEMIDIEDTVAAVVTYENGAKLSYSLNAFMPWEGYVVVFNGTKGRLEHKCEEEVYVSGDGTIPGRLKKEGTWIKIYPLFRPAYGVDVWGGAGGHGGADPIMLKDIFQPAEDADKYMRAADHRAGAWSILCGIAANRSIETGKLIFLENLINDLDRPEFPPMPSSQNPVDVEKLGGKSWYRGQEGELSG